MFTRPRTSSNSIPDGVRHFWDKWTFAGCVFMGVLLCAIGFRIYKAHNTGILYDEVWTYEDYCSNLHTAVTTYTNVNNHVINSCLIVLAEKVWGGYEHFLRIPSVAFGIIFCCSLAAIIHKTIHGRVLRIVALFLILFNWFIVDLSFLARGYAIALGVTFFGIAIMLHRSKYNSERKEPGWWIVILFVFMNFMALGSMLSSLGIVLSINVVYGIWLLKDTIGQGKKALLRFLTRYGTIAIGSILSLYLLYRPILSAIRKRSELFSTNDTFAVYMKKSLWNPLAFLDFSRIRFTALMLKLAIAIVVVCAIIMVVKFVLRLAKEKHKLNFLSNPAALIIILTVVLFSFMAVQRVAFDVSLGMPRNGVFLLVLVLLSSGVIIDRTVEALSRIKILSYGLCSVCASVLMTLGFLNFSSWNAVHTHYWAWAIQSGVAPLVRTLKDIDPDKRWRIKLTEDRTKSCARSIRYYQRFGYNIEVADGDAYDVWILPKSKPDSRYMCLDQKRFDEHHTCVVVNPKSFSNKAIFYELQLAAKVKK